MTNPLLAEERLPQFSAIKPEHIEPALDEVLTHNRAQVKMLLAQQPPFTWANIMEPLEALDDRLSSLWSTISHMNAVVNSDEIRTAYNACLPKLSDYFTEMGQNKNLYLATKSIVEGSEHDTLDDAQQRTLANELRDFHLAGVDLPEHEKKQYGQLEQKLSKLTSKFDENVLDATQGWSRLVTDEAELAGLPEIAVASAKQSAHAKNLGGWLFTLEMPSYLAVMTYADDRSLREEMHIAFVTRASDQGPNAGKWDNSQVMQAILQTRHELARLLQFESFAEMSLATKTAKDTEAVLQFLHQLVDHSLTKARDEFRELQAFAQQQGIDKLMPWDATYYSEKLRQSLFDFSQEDLRPYFAEDQVLKGLFEVVNRLYGIEINEQKGVDVWHPDVRFYTIHDMTGSIRGEFYLDLYARQNKRGGAWMDECRVRRRVNGSGIQTPVAFITCNFNAPVRDDPALLTHSDVETLFHEFGHGFHHMLTQIEYADVSGINGVPWDVVEFPSQFLENWCWQDEALNFIGKHYQTGESIPAELINKLQAAKNFQSAIQMIRQLEFALFDFRLHKEFDPQQDDQIQKILNEVRNQTAVMPIANFNRFQHGFSHIFAGGYAAGYYSYKWAEVLASDAFSKFEEEGIFNPDTGRSFLENILEKGGAYDPIELFKQFRGREPKIEALLRQTGINPTN